MERNTLPLGDDQKLDEMVRELSSALTSVKHEQEYMEVRERVHRSSKFSQTKLLKPILHNSNNIKN